MSAGDLTVDLKATTAERWHLRQFGGRCLVCAERVSPFAGRVVSSIEMDLEGLLHESPHFRCCKLWETAREEHRDEMFRARGVSAAAIAELGFQETFKKVFGAALEKLTSAMAATALSRLYP